MSERQDRSHAEDNGIQIQHDIVAADGTLIPLVYAFERWCKQIDT